MHAPIKYLPIECIFCEEVFRIPQDSPAESVIECPFCKQGFKAKLALAADAPIAKPLSESLTPKEAEETGKQAQPLERTGTKTYQNVESPANDSARPKVAPSGRLQQRTNVSASETQTERPGNEGFRKLKTGQESLGSSSENQSNSTVSTESSKSEAQDLNENCRDKYSESRRRRSGSSGRRSSSRRSSNSSRSSGSRSRRSSVSRLEKDKQWNKIGVDGLPIQASRTNFSELQEHDGGEGGIRELIMIVLGGLFCLPVTQLCLWWFVSIDPLYLGPPVSSVVPQIVPAEFHGIDNAESAID